MVTALFFLFAGLAIACAISLVYHKNPLYSAISLVGVLISLACVYVTLAAPFIAAVQILIYAGAIMVLFLFVIMFLNAAELERERGLWWGFGTILAFMLAGVLVPLFVGDELAEESVTASDIFGSPEMLAKSLFNDFVLPFEIASVLLLVAIIGAVVLAKRER